MQAAAGACWTDAALGSCRRALRLEPGNAPLNALERKLSAAATAAAAASVAGPAAPAPRQNEERWLHAVESEGLATVEFTDPERKQMDLLLASHPDMMTGFVRCAGPPPPKLEELLSAAVLPRGCSMQACKRQLMQASAGVWGWWVKAGAVSLKQGECARYATWEDPADVRPGSLYRHLHDSDSRRLA